MSIIYIVLPLALVIVLAAVLAFTWAAKRGQFDDLDTPALRMLHDDAAIPGRDAGGGGGASSATSSGTRGPAVGSDADREGAG